MGYHSQADFLMNQLQTQTTLDDAGGEVLLRIPI